MPLFLCTLFICFFFYCFFFFNDTATTEIYTLSLHDALPIYAALARAAHAHSEDMARNNYFGHDSRDGASPSDRVMRAGYDFRGTAENIAAGQMSLEAVMAGWVASPGHCANLMDAGYTEM